MITGRGLRRRVRLRTVLPIITRIIAPRALFSVCRAECERKYRCRFFSRKTIRKFTVKRNSKIRSRRIGIDVRY